MIDKKFILTEWRRVDRVFFVSPGAAVAEDGHQTVM